MAVVLPKSTNPNARKPYTVRYWVDGVQKERSFKTMGEARNFIADTEHATRAGTYVDAKLGEVQFVTYAQETIDGMAIADGSKKVYTGVLANWIGPKLACARSLSKVANDREGVTKLVNVTMKHLSYNRRSIAYTVILATVNEAQAAGRIPAHKLSRIKLQRDSAVVEEHKGFYNPTFAELEALANGLNGYAVTCWIMRATGLRVSEALAVRKEDFKVSSEGIVLRITGQVAKGKDEKVALKHRSNKAFRDIPVPAYLWRMIEPMSDGVLSKPSNGGRYLTYDAFQKRFKKVAATVGLPDDFTCHSLRHVFATTLIERNVPIATVSKYLGHGDVAVTSRIYHHLLPSSLTQARSVLDGEYEAWKAG